MYQATPRRLLVLSKAKLISVAKGAAIAAAGAALAYLTQWVTGQDFGLFEPAVVAGLGVLVNLLRKAAAPDEV